MKRLSSDKAKKILEFLIRKRLRAASAKMMFSQCIRRNLYHIDGTAVFTKSDTAEIALIEMELEDTHGN